MKHASKSSITLPPTEFKLVSALRRKTRARSNVEVVRRALHLLRESTDREALREEFRKASQQLSGSTEIEISELDHLVDEGLE